MRECERTSYYQKINNMAAITGYTVTIEMTGYDNQFVSKYDTREEAQKAYDTARSKMGCDDVKITMTASQTVTESRMEHLGHECTITSQPIVEPAPLYKLESYGSDSIIRVTRPSECNFFAQQSLTIAKSDTLDVKATWNTTDRGWVCENKNLEYANAFVTEMNRLYEAEYDSEDMDDSSFMNEDFPLFTITPHGRAYLIRCNDWTACEWWTEKYIALSNNEEPAVAFWNDRLGGYIVRGRDKREACRFVLRANQPKWDGVDTPTTAPSTPIRPSSPVPPNAPARPRKTRSRILPAEREEGEVLKRANAVKRTLCVTDEEEDSDSDYVPSEDEIDSEDDDELFVENTTDIHDGPYSGMTLRLTLGGFYMTCSADHPLYNRPYLGHPAAASKSPNCWFVRSGTETQFLEGGAVFA